MAYLQLLKIKFTTLGETVLEEDIQVQPKEFSGLAVDIDPENNLLDIYTFFVKRKTNKGQK